MINPPTTSEKDKSFVRKVHSTLSRTGLHYFHRLRWVRSRLSGGHRSVSRFCDKGRATGRMDTLGGRRGASLAIQPYMRVARGGGAAGLPLAASGNAGHEAGITPAHAIAHVRNGSWEAEEKS
jgi:hypothetical protein